MSNILLVNDNVQDYSKIINACNDHTYPITYNEGTDTYATIFAKYENLVSKNNIQVLNHVALVSHGSNNPEFTFLERENKMLISHYIEDLSPSSSENENQTYDENHPTAEEEYLTWNSNDSLPEDTSSDPPLNSNDKLIINNLDTWSSFKDFIKKFNIQKSLDFLGCALLKSSNWKYVLEQLESEEHLNLTMRASDDNTGNLKVGGDWVLESDNVNIKDLYFDSESIEKWKYTLNAYNFTNLNGATYVGPTSTSGYNGTNLQGNVTLSGGIQQWTVPSTGGYTIEAWGASGGDGTASGDGHGSGSKPSVNRYGGVGRYVKITTTLTQGTVIYILVGQGGTRTGTKCGGGGGGTFVTKAMGTSAAISDILVIAGGGGGGGRGYMTGVGQSPEINARGVGANGGYSYDYHTSGLVNPGGTGGGGGQYNVSTTRKSQGSTGGGGFIGDGTIGYGGKTVDTGKSFRNGGSGGTGSVYGNNFGGFGGGGGEPHNNHVGGGGGGGYNGGAPGGNYNGAWSGGGGSSYASVTPDTDIEWSHYRTSIISGVARHGKVTITEFDPIEPIPTSNISLSILKEKYVEYDVISGSGNSYLRDSSTTSAINLSYFNGVTLSDFTVISPPISFSQFSGEELLRGYDYPVFIFSTSFRSQSSFSIDSTSSYGPNKKVTLTTTGQTGYGNILPVVNGVNGDNAPAISPTSEYTLWVKLTAVTANYMIGLINRESWRTSWATCVSDGHKIKTQHAMYADRIMFHAYGYFTYSGNRKPSGTDPVLGTTYSGLGSVFYNKMGYTAGAGGVTSSGQTFTLDNAQKFKSSDVTSYVNAIAIGEHIGMRIKYFTATITATLTSGQNYVVISNQNLDDVFSGMRVNGTNIPTNTVLGDVYTNRIYLRDEYTGALKNASGSGTSTLTLTGQLFQFRKSNSSFSNDLLFGPPHIVLPLKYSTVNNNTTPNGDISDWSMVIGDTIGATDSQWSFEIVDDRPVLPEPSWSYTYGIWSTATGTDATTAFREISSRVIIDPSSSDYTGAYDVTSLQVNAVGSKRIYLALKVTASTTYYNDICIAGVQRISSSGTVLNSWIFNTSSGGTGSTWQTTTGGKTGSSSLLSSSWTPSSASSQTYYSISSGYTRDKMNWATSTGSVHTGAAGGISTGSYGSTQFPVGNSKLTQTGTTYYAYREVSGSTRYTSTFFRSPLVTFNGTDTIKVAHLITTRSGQTVNANDSIWLGVY